MEIAIAAESMIRDVLKVFFFLIEEKLKEQKKKN